MFALDELTRLSGPEVTRELLRALDSGDVVPSPVLQKAMDVLVARQDRALLAVYMDALKVHPDYAEDRAAQAAGVLRAGGGGAEGQGGVPLLVEHLRLPDTDLEAVSEIADAALALEAKESLEPFEDFLLQYRADPAFRGPARAADLRGQRAAQAGRAQGARPLLFVAEHPQTLEAVATHIRRSLAQPAPGEKPEAHRPSRHTKVRGRFRRLLQIGKWTWSW